MKKKVANSLLCKLNEIRYVKGYFFLSFCSSLFIILQYLSLSYSVKIKKKANINEFFKKNLLKVSSHSELFPDNLPIFQNICQFFPLYRKKKIQPWTIVRKN